MLHAERTELITAAPEEVWAVVADVPGYAEWHPFFAEVDVRERDDAGRVVLAACRHVTSVVTLRTELRFEYDDGLRVSARGQGNDIKSLTGGFDLVRDAGGVALRHTLEVDPGFKLGLMLRGPVEERVRQGVLDGAFRGVRRRVDAPHPHDGY